MLDKNNGFSSPDDGPSMCLANLIGFRETCLDLKQFVSSRTFVNFAPLKKFLHTFFLLYFIGLVFVPCNGQDECIESSQHEVVIDSECGPCAPLCICATCATVMLHKEIQDCKWIVREVETVFSAPYTPSLPHIFFPVWQPPKV